MDTLTLNQFASFVANSITINEHAFIVILASLYCIFCVAIIAGGSIKVKRFKRWG